MARSIVSFDLDGTLVPGISSGQFLADRLGHGDALRELELGYDNGRLQAAEVAQAEAAYFRGRSIDDVTAILRHVPLIAGIEETVEELRRRDVFLVINTLAWSFIASDIGARFGFDASTGVEMAFDQTGAFAGSVARHFDEHDKVRFVIALATRLNVPVSRVVSIGDARSDLPLFRASGFSIALNGSPEARRAATVALDTDCISDVLPAIPLAVLG